MAETAKADTRVDLSALLAAGVSSFGAGDWAAARKAANQVLELLPSQAIGHPATWDARNLLAAARLRMGELADGVADLEKLFVECPSKMIRDNLAESLVMLSTAKEREGDLPGALAAAERALWVNGSKRAELALLPVRLLALKGDRESALVRAKLICRAWPASAAAQLMCANIEKAAGDGMAAIRSYHQAGKLAAEAGDKVLLQDAYTNYVALLVRTADYRRLNKALLEGASLDVSKAALVNANALSLLDKGRGHQALAVLEEVRSSREHVVWQNLAFIKNYITGFSRQEERAAHEDWARLSQELADQAGIKTDSKPIARLPRPDELIKIGFVSGDLREHSVAYFMWSLFTYLDRQRFYLHVYNVSSDRDEITNSLQQLVTMNGRGQWVDASTAGVIDLRNKIATDGVHVLIDLAGFTSGNRLTCFVLRAAPVQISYLGYANTSGTKSMDYRIVDNVTDPPEWGNDHATETLIRLPRCFVCYSMPPLISRGTLELTEKAQGNAGPVVLGSFSAGSKLSDETLSMWAKILWQCNGHKLDPAAAKKGQRAVLFFKTRCLQHTDGRLDFVERLSQAGIAPWDVRLEGAQRTTAEHLQLYRQVHIALDPWPYSGTTTTCEAMLMGVPVITLTGERHASNVSASIIAHTAWEPLLANICRTPEEYIQRVCSLVASPTDLAAISGQTLRKHFLHSPACDGPGHAAAFGAAIEDAITKANTRQIIC